MNKTLFAIIAVITLVNAVLVYVFKKPYKELNIESMEKQAALNSQIIAVTKDGFRGKFKLPCIVRQFNCEGLNHFVVLHKIGWKHFLVADPAKGLQKVRKDSFFNDLNRYAVICAPMSTLDRVREKSAFGRFFSF